MTEPATADFTVEDVEFLSHDGKPLLARVFTPAGPGPFAAMLELHGGGWCRFDRTRDKSVHEALARGGIVAVAIDFRQGAEGAYPLSVADINYGIRWVKANAARLKIDSERVGISGNSSGGTLAMLTAMRPDDKRYAAIPLAGGAPVDASVGCVALLWPVIDPLSRYHHAQRKAAEKEPGDDVDWATLVGLHDDYWRTEEAMAEGNPLAILNRGENIATPPVLWIQVRGDEVHDYVDPESADGKGQAERFAEAYEKAGGAIEIEYFTAPPMFATQHPTLPESIAALDELVAFVKASMPETVAA